MTRIVLLTASLAHAVAAALLSAKLRNMRRFAATAFGIFAILFHAITLAAETRDADLLIVGGNESACAAAVQAARLGKSVSLAVFGAHIGGLTSGGLGATDTGNSGAIQGISREFYNRIAARYAVAGPKFTFEPHVAEEVFGAMLSEVGVVARRFLRPHIAQ